MAHDHKSKANFKRVHGDRYTPYEPGIRGCKECQAAADRKNHSLKMAANDNFLKKNRLV